MHGQGGWRARARAFSYPRVGIRVVAVEAGGVQHVDGPVGRHRHARAKPVRRRRRAVTGRGRPGPARADWVGKEAVEAGVAHVVEVGSLRGLGA